MVSEREIMDLVGLIYEAAGDGRLWAELIERLGIIMRTGYVQMGIVEGKTNRLLLCPGVDPSSVSSYNEHFGKQDVWMARAPKSFWTPGYINTSDAIISDPDLEKTGFYQDWVRPQRLYYGMAASILREGNRVSAISFLRDKRAGPCGKAETDLLKALMPHLHRAVALHARIVTLESKEKSMADVLDRLPVGLILLAHNGKVLTANRSARVLLDSRDGVAQERGILRALLPGEDKQIQLLLHGATGRQPAKSAHPGGVMAISRPSGHQPLSLFITPLPTAQPWVGAEAPQAAVFISDPERDAARQEDILARLFGLTAAEARLADALLAGKNLTQAADEFGVTRNTVRSQLQRIFDKTGTNRQSQLVRILIGASGHFRAD